MSLHDRLMASPAAINRMAALHISGGDRTGKEELLWEQNERYHNIATQLPVGSPLKDHAKLYDAICKLVTLKSGTFPYKDWKKYVRKLWIKAHNGGSKNMDVRLNDAIARAFKRYEATTL
jgi:hypothetical protein